jgi:nucleoside 2-deoxyribosyltransferase
MRRVFLAGIIQGSNKDRAIHSQDYRGKIKSIVREAYPEAAIYDPLQGHLQSVDYDDEKGKETFSNSLAEIDNCDLMIAYLPVASLGTAIEIWESYRRGIPVWTITGMKTNWVVRFFSERIFEDIESFADYMEKSHSAALRED